MDSHSTVGISLQELISVAITIVVVLWALGKIGFSQFKEMMENRFQTIDQKLKTLDPLHDELHRIDKDVASVRLEMATSYVRQEGIRQLTVRMEELFKEVFAKLDSKADKSECANHHTERRQ